MPEEGDAVQPEGQGGDEQGGLYDLSQVPEEYRPHVEPFLKEMEGNATRKFQEHADYRKQWEPYEQLGVNDYDPEGLSSVLQFAQIAQAAAEDPDSPAGQQFAQWWYATGQELGLFEEDGEGGEPEQENQFDPEQLQDMLTGVLDQRLGPIEQTFEQQQQEQRVAAAGQELDSNLEALHKQHGDFDDDRVCQLSLAYADELGPEEALAAGLKDFQQIMAGAENGMVNSKLDQPQAPETGGRPGTAQEPVTDFKEAKRIARERFEQLQ